MSESRLIVGLGNPGKEYEYTRHNLGFLAVQAFAEQENLKWESNPYCKGDVTRGELDNQKFFLLLPYTFMNNSGIAVKHLVKEKDIALENILVVCDDLHVEFGQLRLRTQGSAGGHNGLTSIIHHLNSNNFSRLRVGIGHGKPIDRDKMVDFVLGEFSSSEKKKIAVIADNAANCCRAWLTQDIKDVMNAFNEKKDI